MLIINPVWQFLNIVRFIGDLYWIVLLMTAWNVINQHTYILEDGYPINDRSAYDPHC